MSDNNLTYSQFELTKEFIDNLKMIIENEDVKQAKVIFLEIELKY